MILPAQTIRALRLVEPFYERSVAYGLTYGLGPAGYDVRIAQRVAILPGQFQLASTVERIVMPLDLLGRICDKSSWARRGLAVQNTIIEPGWRGFLTLELTNHGSSVLSLDSGCPIAQIIFERLEEATTLPYDGKYQDQPQGPQPALEE
jgi:dCTP deaminase